MIQSGGRLAGDARAVVTFPTQSQLTDMLMIRSDGDVDDSEPLKRAAEMSMIQSGGRKRRRCHDSRICRGFDIQFPFFKWI
ncbi:hypothetical protein HanXRQr2_Chr16g0751401 [Helianthus annuus]|uniref:Uncharacterized protein n=1 Tax=Helianthus annuus TaxID=4232 RepID=A0A9K3DT87_HELAN|nr:hypothetical protein HanXRQr2_Chr16g0751401 [Helianthus annuus]KAJ0821428.1 hypothetical protein HanPSC8_Chr16g0720071 [Helianthus annuus]